jgi:hypothetical protein
VSVGFDSSLGEEDIQKFEKRPKVVPLFFFKVSSKTHLLICKKKSLQHNKRGQIVEPL